MNELDPGRWLSTEEVAALFGVQPQTLRHALCHRGSYHGLRPRKLPNRLLRWPADEVAAVMRGERVGERAA